MKTSRERKVGSILQDFVRKFASIIWNPFSPNAPVPDLQACSDVFCSKCTTSQSGEFTNFSFHLPELSLRVQTSVWVIRSLIKVPYMTALPQMLWTSLTWQWHMRQESALESWRFVPGWTRGAGKRSSVGWDNAPAFILPGASLSGGRGLSYRLREDQAAAVWGQSCQHDSSRALTTCSRISGQ